MSHRAHHVGAAQPWWKFGHVWLVMAGPAVVVVAGFITLYLAMRTARSGGERGLLPPGHRDQQDAGGRPGQPGARRCRRATMPPPAWRPLPSRRPSPDYSSGDRGDKHEHAKTDVDCLARLSGGRRARDAGVRHGRPAGPALVRPAGDLVAPGRLHAGIFCVLGASPCSPARSPRCWPCRPSRSTNARCRAMSVPKAVPSRRAAAEGRSFGLSGIPGG